MMQAENNGGRGAFERLHAFAITGALAAGALLLSALPLTPGGASAKTPGRVYCYHGVCHRVHAVDEVSRLIGEIRQETASYYGTPGRPRSTLPRTSSGETCKSASRHRVSSSIYPDGTELLLWNPRNGRAAHVRVNDLGPFHGRRTLDLTRGLADDLGFRVEGVTPLQVFVISAPDARLARHNPSRAFPATRGYLGTLDEDGVHALADDLVDIAMEQSGVSHIATAAAATPVAQTPEIAISSEVPSATVRYPDRAPILVAAAEADQPRAVEHEPAREIRAAATSAPQATETSAAASPLPAPAAAVTEATASAAIGLAPIAATQASVPALMTPLASGASRNLLLLAFVMTLATLLLARVRRPAHIVAGLPAAEPAPRALLKTGDATLAVAFRRLTPDTEPRPPRGDAATDAIDSLGLRRHARYLMDAGERPRAEEMLRHLLETLEASLGSTHAELAEPLKLWGNCVRDLGRHADARQIYARALTLAGADAALIADIREERARLDLAAQRLAEAAADARAAATQHREAGRPAYAIAPLLLLAEAQHGSGEFASAEQSLREALSFAAPREEIAACEAAVGLAHILASRGAAHEALGLVADALAALDAHLGLATGLTAVRNLDPVADYHAIDVAVQVRRRAIELTAELTGVGIAERMPLATLIQ